MKTALIAVIFLAAVRAPGSADLSGTSAEALIDDLAQIDTPTPGIHGTAIVLAFIAEEKPPKFGGGVLGSAPPTTPPAMRELARRGPLVLPALIKHLDDKRPTKLTIGNGWFMFRCFGDEYDPRARPAKRQDRSFDPLKRSFEGGYTVKVGDVCYAIIGQIVNRNLLPVRYQPTAGLIINSPLESPLLAERTRNDWSGLDVPAHKASLIADARRNEHPWESGPALVRLRFYYPDDYERLKAGDLKKRISDFEKDEREQH